MKESGSCESLSFLIFRCRAYLKSSWAKVFR